MSIAKALLPTGRASGCHMKTNYTRGFSEPRVFFLSDHHSCHNSMKKRMKIIAQELSSKNLLSFRSQAINSLLSIMKDGWLENIIRKFQKGIGTKQRFCYNRSTT